MTATSIHDEVDGHDQVDEIFADARQIHAQAVARLEMGDIRDSTEKAWRAAKRATDTLILALIGKSQAQPDLPVCLDDLVVSGRAPNSLQRRYYSRLSQLHGTCFCTGACNQHTERCIRETAGYIAEVETLAVR